MAGTAKIFILTNADGGEPLHVLESEIAGVHTSKNMPAGAKALILTKSGKYLKVKESVKTIMGEFSKNNGDPTDLTGK